MAFKKVKRWTRASAKIEADVISCVHQVYDGRRGGGGGDDGSGRRGKGGGTRKESDERAACPDGSDFIALEFLLTERLDKNN